MSTNKIPKIRFKGFVEEWENRNFDTVFTGISNNTLSRDNLNYQKGIGKNVHYGDVLIKFNNILDIEKEIVPFISDNKIVEKLKSSKLNNGDIIFADAAEDEIVGKCVEINNIKDNLVFSGLHTIAVRPKFEFAEKYLGYYLNSKPYHNQFLKLMQGTKVLSISKTAIKTTNLNYPSSKTEQTKIGSFFENIDQLVNQHQTQHKKLTALKKAMLSKLFPKQGKKIPEIRFKGFSEEWEVKKLGEVLSFKNGQGHEQIISESGKIIVINSKYISSNGNTAKYCENIIVPLKNKDIVMVMSDIPNGKALAKCMLITNEKNYSLNQRICALSEQNDDNIFLFYQINRNNYFLSFDNGVSQTNLKLQEILDCPLFCPDKKEQEKIGNYFQNLDNLIANHSQQLEKLEVLKKACLAKMFV
ncbi:restriction endonuclease subunit S [Tenacibaculum finnmarkense]|uniref:restriction endonuclease subunit S n=1 Tax=Tenacibaculum finnmarkense TaxID=2781243 RepID=UPI001E5DD45C|nr:restriction endonuclease subunit S [Tenacibaculum finnmarkense]MCD8402076.1 restriction endonuclease subunit S [Tenacibaculum finnmarkense genomovar finnmarkense]